MFIFPGIALLLVASAHATLLPGTSLPPSGYIPLNNFNSQWSYQPSNTQTKWSWEQPALNSYQQWSHTTSPTSELVHIPTWSEFRAKVSPASAPACVQTHCAAINAPVCGLKADGGSQEFANVCSYNNHVRCNARAGSFTMYVNGRCTKPNNQSRHQPAPTPNHQYRQPVPPSSNQYRQPVPTPYHQSHQPAPTPYHQSHQPAPTPYHQSYKPVPTARPVHAAPACDVNCGMVYQPVCGINENGKKQTFGNSCEYNGHVSCHPGSYSRSVPGRCEDISSATPVSNPPFDECANRMCPHVYQPLCGMSDDGKKYTFGNSCEYEGHKKCSRSGIAYTKTIPGRCEDVTPSDECANRICPQNIQAAPVCGISEHGHRKQFNGDCEYEGYRKCNPAGKSFTKSVPGRCNDIADTPTRSEDKSGAKPNMSCPGMCPQNYAPVCAINEKDGTTYTFGNSCGYEDHKRCNPDTGYTKLTELEKCRKPTPTPKPAPAPTPAPSPASPKKEDQRSYPCPGMCPQNYAPVCAVNEKDGTTYTFGNSCGYEDHKRCNPDSGFTKLTELEKCRKPTPTPKPAPAPTPAPSPASPRKEDQRSYPCPGMCPQNYAPVCAVNEKDGTTYTFSNSCGYEDHQRCNPDSGFTKLTELEKCRKPTPTPKPAPAPTPAPSPPSPKKEDQRSYPCPGMCPQNYAPVCAVNEKDGTTYTFGNSCGYEDHKRCNPDSGYTKLIELEKCRKRST